MASGAMVTGFASSLDRESVFGNYIYGVWHSLYVVGGA